MSDKEEILEAIANARTQTEDGFRRVLSELAKMDGRLVKLETAPGFAETVSRGVANSAQLEDHEGRIAALESAAK